MGRPIPGEWLELIGDGQFLPSLLSTREDHQRRRGTVVRPPRPMMAKGPICGRRREDGRTDSTQGREGAIRLATAWDTSRGMFSFIFWLILLVSLSLRG